MGKPEAEKDFTKFIIEESIEVYVDNEVLKRLEPGEKELKFLFPEYGWQHLTFLEDE
jgi:hypothetical protein